MLFDLLFLNNSISNSTSNYNPIETNYLQQKLQLQLLQQPLQVQLQPQQPLLRQVGSLPVLAVNNSIYQNPPPCSSWAEVSTLATKSRPPRWRSSPLAPGGRLTTASSSLCPLVDPGTTSTGNWALGNCPLSAGAGLWLGRSRTLLPWEAALCCSQMDPGSRAVIWKIKGWEYCEAQARTGNGWQKVKGLKA